MTNEHPPALQFAIQPSVFEPLIVCIVEQTIARLEAARATIPDKLAFSEAEAARLMSLQPHQLRDERLRGRIKASVGPDKKVLYSRDDLLAYLASRRWSPREHRTDDSAI